MKIKYLAIIITTVAISATLLTSLAYAQATVNIYAWTDKAYYDPGEKGTLHIVIRNDRTDVDLILQNITITYPWFAYTGEKWEGNDTIRWVAPETPPVITKDGGVYSTSVEFVVPTDGRVSGLYGVMPQINLVITVDKTPYQYSRSTAIYIQGTPLYMSFEDMDKIVTLFTVQVVLVIVCTVIIAATIFLSGRRPQVMRRREEKPE